MSSRIFTLLLLLLAPCTLLRAEGITVQGSASVSVPPDMATFNFSILERGPNLSRLKSSVDGRSADLIDLARALGVVNADITSAEVRIRPRYNHPEARLLGYDVSRDIRVVLKDLDRYSELVNGAIEAGISNLGNIQLDVSQRTSLQVNSLAAAMAVARRKAQIIAAEAGVTLGRVTGVSEAGLPVEMPLYQARAESMAMDSRSAFEPGKIVISSQVSVTYAID